MEILFLWGGLVFVAVGALIILSELKVRKGALRTPGRIAGFSLSKDSSGEKSFHAVITFSGLDGCQRYLVSQVGSSSPIGRTGDAVNVLLRRDDPESAALHSPLTWVLGAAIGLMGAACCAAFLLTFRADALSVALSLAVTLAGAWKLKGALRERPLSWRAWREYKDQALRAKVYTEERKREIAWADEAAVTASVRARERAYRFARPLLIAAGLGLLLLGGHLYHRTKLFLAGAVATEGRVVGLEPVDSSDGTTYAPVVEFRRGDAAVRFRDTVSSDPPSYRIDDRVPVLFHPTGAPDARIDRGRWNLGLPVLLAGSGATLLLLGLLLRGGTAAQPK
jgi:hypothetical protein